MEGRERTLWLVGAGIALLSLIVAIVLAGGSGDGDGSVRSFDGVLVEVEDDRLLFYLDKPLDGRNQIELVVRPEDRPALDISHLEQHVVDRYPTRIYYERDGSQYVAREYKDLEPP